ncbi:hypothetical protein AGMMS49574_22560 [Bacteroidia bacterium]|nr:hypothetical protein AGMMS49574_22560 [Bacteroidia bacterium]
MKEALIVPDVHGRSFWHPALDYAGDVVFLGDYVDPYPQEGISEEQGYKELLKIVDFKKQNSERVTLLVGNHELHYYNKGYQCSRFSAEYYPKIHEILTGDETKGLFQLCKQEENFLFIHAGLLKGWYKKHYKEFAPLGNTLEEQLNRLFEVDQAAFFEVSFERGGWDAYGSPLWADIHEHLKEKEPFDSSITQVIGHTQIPGDAYMKGNHFRLIDNRKLYMLKDGEIIDK